MPKMQVGMVNKENGKCVKDLKHELHKAMI